MGFCRGLIGLPGNCVDLQDLPNVPCARKWGPITCRQNANQLNSSLGCVRIYKMVYGELSGGGRPPPAGTERRAGRDFIEPNSNCSREPFQTAGLIHDFGFHQPQSGSIRGHKQICWARHDALPTAAVSLSRQASRPSRSNLSASSRTSNSSGETPTRPLCAAGPSSGRDGDPGACELPRTPQG